MIALTSAGRQMAENTQGHGPDYAVLSALYEVHGPMEVEEIMDATHMNPERARGVLKNLLARGLITQT